MVRALVLIMAMVFVSSACQQAAPDSALRGSQAQSLNVAVEDPRPTVQQAPNPTITPTTLPYTKASFTASVSKVERAWDNSAWTVFILVGDLNRRAQSIYTGMNGQVVVMDRASGAIIATTPVKFMNAGSDRVVQVRIQRATLPKAIADAMTAMEVAKATEYEKALAAADFALRNGTTYTMVKAEDYEPTGKDFRAVFNAHLSLHVAPMPE